MKLWLPMCCLFWSLPVSLASAAVHPENSFLSSRPMVARADGEQSCKVVVAIHDEQGVPIVGQSVILVSSRGADDQVLPASGLTDSNGRCEFTVRSKKSGVSTLTAKCDSVTIGKYVQTDGLVAYYTFDGMTETARVRDLSGNENHGVLHGTPRFVPGHRGDAIEFDATKGDQYVEVANSKSLSGQRGNGIEAWIRKTSAPKDDDFQVIAQKSFANRGDYALTTHGLRLAYHYRCTQRPSSQLEEALSDLSVISPGEWTRVLGYWEGSDIHERVRSHGYVRAYANQVETFDEVPVAQQVEGIWHSRTENQPLSIGRAGDGSHYFDGQIDELKIYDRALYDLEMRRNHEGICTVTFGLETPVNFAADAGKLPECVQLSWGCDDANVTTFSVYRALSADGLVSDKNLLMTLPHWHQSFRDYEVDHGVTYHYAVLADSFGNKSLPSTAVSATPVKAKDEPRWYGGDGHFHTFTHDDKVEDFTPELTVDQAKKAGWDFVVITEHNSLASYFRGENQGTESFIVFGTGQEISNGSEHRTGMFLKHFIPTSSTTTQEQNEMALAMGAEVGPNHNAYRDGPPNITQFELVNNRKWFPYDAWEENYLKKGIHVTAKGGSDAHGRFSVKRGLRWYVYADRLSYRALKQAIQKGRTVAVDGEGLLANLKVNGEMIGGTVRLKKGTPLQIEVSANCEKGTVSEVKLVKFGEVVKTWQPEQASWSTQFEDGLFDGGKSYYRLEAVSKDADRRLVSSAVFIEEVIE